MHACAVEVKTHKFQEIQSFMRVSASDGEKKAPKSQARLCNAAARAIIKTFFSALPLGLHTFVECLTFILIFFLSSPSNLFFLSSINRHWSALCVFPHNAAQRDGMSVHLSFDMVCSSSATNFDSGLKSVRHFQVDSTQSTHRTNLDERASEKINVLCGWS